MTGRFGRFILVIGLALGVQTTLPAAEITVVAHDPGYYTSLAAHLRRWLASGGIPAAQTTAAGMARELRDARLAFLVGFTEPTVAELNVLRDYRRRGGRLVVFHCASASLAALMGVKPLGYRTAPYPGAWSRMNFAAMRPEGCPASILQTSTVLQRAVPATAEGRILATWADRTGAATGDAAWIATPAGWWMTHVLLADGDEALKARLLASLVGAVSPRLWNARKAAAVQAATETRLQQFALEQKSRRGEIRAVWDHSGCGLYPGDWPRTFRILRAYRVTDLFVNVAGAGFAHYPSRVLPRSKILETEGNQLAACLVAARGTGIRVHAWFLCFNATRSTPSRLEDFRARGWRLKTTDGRLSEYLDPSNAALRTYLLAAIDELVASYAVQGVHLDFVRWYERSVRPSNAAAHVSAFVSAARRHVKGVRGGSLWLTTAVLGKYPACVASVGQDWVSWLDLGLVDYVVPMDYTENLAKFSSFVNQHAAHPVRARRTIAGIGVTANESRLDARQVIEQINVTRRAGLAGVALFDLDTTLEKDILPYLRLGLWQ